MKARSVLAGAALAALLALPLPVGAQPAEPAAPPPPPQAEVVPPNPGGPVVWQPGYWAWNGRWVWVAGRYERTPRPGAVWVPGHWVQGPLGRWRWIPGHWG